MVAASSSGEGYGVLVNGAGAGTLRWGEARVVGRAGGGADVEVDDAAVSGRHVRLEVCGDERREECGLVVATDMGSTNGTAIRRKGGLFGASEQPMKADVGYALASGDALVLATRVVLTFEPVEGDAPAAAPDIDARAMRESAGEAMANAASLFGALATGAAAAGKATADMIGKGAQAAQAARAEQEASPPPPPPPLPPADAEPAVAVEATPVVVEEDDAPDAGKIVLAEPVGLAEASSPDLRLTDADDSDASLAESIRSALASTSGDNPNMINSSVQLNIKPTFIQNTAAATSPDQTTDAKTQLLTAILGLDRGLAADANAKRRVQKLACALEAANPTARPLRSPLMNGEWELQYTTAKAAVGGGGVLGAKPIAGGVRQRVDMYSMKLINETEYSIFGQAVTNRAIADVDAQSDTRIALDFTDFELGPLKLSAPPKTPARLAIEWELQATGRGGKGAWLETTYLDYDVRISRNDLGDLFVLTKVADA